MTDKLTLLKTQLTTALDTLNNILNAPIKETIIGKKWLIPLLGQSNCQSANKGPRTSEDTIHSRIFMYNREISNHSYDTKAKGMWIPAQDPLQHLMLFNDDSIGFGLSFAKELLNHIGENDEIYLVPCALGGSGFVPIDLGYGKISWRQGFVGFMALYELALETIKKALESIPGLQIRCILWHQGETDAAGHNFNYHQDIINLVSNYRKDLNSPNLPFICGTMLNAFKLISPAKTTYVDNIHKNIKNIIWLADCAVFDDLTGEQDNTHFDAKSQREMGKRYCNKLLEVEEKSRLAMIEWKKLQNK